MGVLEPDAVLGIVPISMPHPRAMRSNLLRAGQWTTLGYLPQEAEVKDVFEVPLAFLMDPAHHERHSRDWQGHTRYYYAMPWQGRYIWGATAGMIRNLYRLMYEPT